MYNMKTLKRPEPRQHYFSKACPTISIICTSSAAKNLRHVFRVNRDPSLDF